MRLPATAIVAVSLAACSVSMSSREQLEGTRNSCEHDAECGEGRCSAGTCTAPSTTFAQLLLEVVPSASSAVYTGVQFLQDLTVPTQGPLDVPLGPLAVVEGEVRLDEMAPSTCPQRVPATITFVPTRRLLGLSSYSYSAQTDGNHRFSLELPAGDYNIYARPAPTESSDCVAVPQLYRNQTIGAARVELMLTQAPPSKLDITIEWRPDQTQSLDGWTLDIIDRTTSRVLSNEVLLGSPIEDEDLLKYSAELRYAPVVGDPNDVTGQELVRLRPPEDTVAPTFLMVREGLEIFSVGEAVVGQLKALPPPVEVEWVVDTAEEEGDIEPVPANVTLLATEISGLEDVVLASFRQEVTADAQGRFRARLFPGKYRLHVVPPAGSGLAAGEKEEEISAVGEYQAGRHISLRRAAPLVGSAVVSWMGQPAVGADVQAVPVPRAERYDALQTQLGQEPFLPRATAQQLGPDGVFALQADPGHFHVQVRPSQQSGLPWFVHQGIFVAQEEGCDVGRIDLTLPSVHDGQLSLPGQGAADDQGLPNALIRAFVYVDVERNVTSDAQTAASVVQVGETRSDADGRFSLMLPTAIGDGRSVCPP